MIQQFYATHELGLEEDIVMTWMTGHVLCRANFSEFSHELGYPYHHDSAPAGCRMHQDGIEYDKKLLAPLVPKEGAIATTKGLKQVYNIVIYMCRWSIAPQDGNTDAICGALVNLMLQAHKVFLAGPNYHGFEVDVMDFIKCEINIDVHERKTPIYAPYIMKLILEQLPQFNQSRFTHHKFGNLQVLTHHLATPASYQDIEDQEAPRARRKNATPPSWTHSGKQRVNAEVKKASWWQKAMICMGVAVHKENHQTYVTNKKILSNKKLMMKKMHKMNNGGSTPPHRANEPATSSDTTIPP